MNNICDVFVKHVNTYICTFISLALAIDVLSGSSKALVLHGVNIITNIIVLIIMKIIILLLLS